MISTTRNIPVVFHSTRSLKDRLRAEATKRNMSVSRYIYERLLRVHRLEDDEVARDDRPEPVD